MYPDRFTEAWLVGRDGHRFYTRTYAAADTTRAVLIFIHGFGDHISRYAEIHPRFAHRGITVFAYDLRGFGRTALDEENRSPDEYYGKTNRMLEHEDLEYWIHYVSRMNPGKPIFVMGHSAGGGMVLAFATRETSPPSAETLSMLSGVIAQAPLIGITYPPSKVARFAVRTISKVFPSLPIAAPMPEERFSRIAEVCDALAKDPLRFPRGTARGLSDMLSQGDELLDEAYKRWPHDLPVLNTWGTVDEVNCPRAGVAFFRKLEAKDKRLVEYDGAYHDLLHETTDISDTVIDEYIEWMLARLHVLSPSV